ncbi:MAG: VWA domain-containing protein [Thermoanaerobaculia bacterium]
MYFHADGCCAKPLNLRVFSGHRGCTGGNCIAQSNRLPEGLMLLHRRLVPLALLFLLVLPSSAQQQLPPASETIDVSIINVDVFVTDKNGNRVYGLTADDFEIRENGKPQPISNFAEYAPETKLVQGTVTVEGAPAAATSRPTVTAAPPTPRTIVIFVDLVPQPSARVREVFGALRDFVDKAVRPGDAATVVVFDARLSTRQEFTDDKAALKAALARLENGSIGVAPDPTTAYRRALASDQAAEMLSRLGDKSVQGQVASTAGLERKAAELFEYVEMTRKTAALTSIMESMSGVEGKKIMVMAMHRFGLRPGFNGYGANSPTAFSMDLRVEKLRQSVMRTANANGVTLYPIQPLGLGWTNKTDSEEERPNVDSMSSDTDLDRFALDNSKLVNQTASFVELAKETGGLMAFGPSDIVQLLPRVVDDLESYYSLAYRATPTGKDVRRKVVVTMKNRDYEVRSRRAVVEKSDDTQMDDVVVANLFQPIEHSVIPIDVKLGAVTKVRKNLWSVPIMVRIPIGALTTSVQEQAASGSFSVFVGTGGEFGVISDVTRRTQPYSIKASDLADAAKSHFTYNATVEFDNLVDAISVGVRDDFSKEYGVVRLPIPARDGIKEKRGGSLE